MQIEEDEDAIVFHRDVMFGEYRADPALLRDVGWLSVKRPAAAAAAMPREQLTPPEPVPEVEVRDEAPLDAMLASQQALVYALFHYLSEAFVQRLSPSMEQLLEMLKERCRPLAPVVEEQAPLIKRVWLTFVQRLLVETLAEDQAGSKIREARQMLEEPYLLDAQRRVVAAGRNNTTNTALIRRLTRETVEESFRFDDDEFRKQCVGPMKRGRRAGNKKPVELNQLQLIKKHFTTKTSQAKSERASHVDAYPLFFKVLTVVAAGIPDPTANHGWYLKTLYEATERLSSAEWPARGLVRALMNAERVLPRRRHTLTEVDFQLCGGQLHCAYSGRRLEVGDEVWHLRVVLNSGARYKKWQKKGRMPPVPCADRFFTRSVRAYFVLTRVSSLSSLFYAPLPEVAAPPPLTPKEEQVDELPQNRQFCVNTLWVLLNQQRQFIATNKLLDHVFSLRGSGFGSDQSYGACSARLQQLLQGISPLAFRKQFLTFLAVAVFGEAYVRQLLTEEAGPLPPQFSAYCDMLWDTVLDFVDLHFVCTPSSATTAQTPTVSFAQFNLELLGVVLEEGDLTRKKFTQHHGKLWLPRLAASQHHATGGPCNSLAAQLLWESTKRIQARAQKHMLFSERQQRLWRVQRLLQQHPFLFMTLFECLFEPLTQSLPVMSRFPDALTLFNRLNLCLTTVH